MNNREIIITDSLEDDAKSIHTFQDYNCILNSVNCNPPDMKTHTVDLPGSDGVLDLSTALSNGIPKYGNRTVEFKLAVTGKNWRRTANDIINDIHGQKKYFCLPDDNKYWFFGRLICSIENNKVYGIITITADCNPWKIKKADEKKVINCGTIEKEITIRNDGKRTEIPKIYVPENTVTITYKENTITGLKGPATYILTEIPLKNGITKIKVKASANTDICLQFREAVL